MSALFNFRSFLTVQMLGICTCPFLKLQFPALLEQRTGSSPGCPEFNAFSAEFRAFSWKAARIAVVDKGERLSPWVAVGCFTMGVSIIFF
ncbi:hypothetical protein Pint_23700 [Pistacia integerrima]|uniref:Uncharacterized protein n=1 Tax=Pistacia integerrima TaxID=434235 RepID=A0ACC0YIZ6_9ROSI|nr:hypothetical protein Pint_23700 [Pistacia integerrima]